MELEEYLNNLNLCQYLQPFLENGVDDIEILSELTEAHLEKIGVKIGHIIRLKKSIQKIKDSGLPTCESYKLKQENPCWSTERVLKTTDLKLTKPSGIFS